MNQLSGYDVFEVAGEKLPFKFGVNAYSLFCKHRSIELGEVNSTGLYGTFDGDKIIKGPDTTANIEMAYFAYVTALRMKNQEPDHNLIEFTEMISEEKDILLKLQELNLSARFMGYTFTELAKKGIEESKKK